jgi:hypothetical protein
MKWQSLTLKTERKCVFCNLPTSGVLIKINFKSKFVAVQLTFIYFSHHYIYIQITTSKSPGYVANSNGSKLEKSRGAVVSSDVEYIQSSWKCGQISKVVKRGQTHADTRLFALKIFVSKARNQYE